MARTRRTPPSASAPMRRPGSRASASPRGPAGGQLALRVPGGMCILGTSMMSGTRHGPTTTRRRGTSASSRSPIQTWACTRECELEGTTHAASGMIAGAALAFAVPGPWQHHLALAAVQGLAVGGLALAPDIDHPRATFAWTAGPLSRGVSHLAAVAFGGHRPGLHRIPATAALSGLALWTVGVAHCRPAAWAFGAFLAVLVAGGLIAPGFARQGPVALLAGAGLAWYVVTRDPGAPAWMIALGMGLHIAEDCCTGYGTALLWPFRRRRYLGARARVQRTTHGVSRARKARGGRPAAGRATPAAWWGVW